MPNFTDIPQLPRAYSTYTVAWKQLNQFLNNWEDTYGLDLNPPYQRGHVWTKEQQIAYVEYVLMGGEVSKTILWNDQNDGRVSSYVPVELIDGKQRLQAVRAWFKDEFPTFGHVFSEWEGPMRPHLLKFDFQLCCLSPEEVLRVYLNINAGGTPHTTEELDRVREMLRTAQKNHV